MWVLDKYRMQFHWPRWDIALRIDLSSIGIEQLKNAAVSQHLNIDAKVADLCTYSPTERLDIILLIARVI